jgi:Chaperone of endosialidase
VGNGAGQTLTTGSNDIDIGNNGLAAESNTIRIGTQGTQTDTYIAGVFASASTGDTVVVSNTGKLGVVLSSARYKRDIRDMDEASNNLMRLRPVTFRYKQDPQGMKQYGLVAEEVERLYPELVTHSLDGQIQSVRYSMLTSMLLNEIQKQARENHRQVERINRLSMQMGQMQERLSALEQTLQAQNGNRKLAAVFNR